MHLFFSEDLAISYLTGEEARHCYKVLRLTLGDQIQITDGKGRLAKAVLTQVDANRVDFHIVQSISMEQSAYAVHMAICPTRKAERNEWMVEKMTELGVLQIQFVVSEHTHRETLNRVVNLERLNRIALSAMKQSQQYFLPKISIQSSFPAFLAQVDQPQRYIAYVTDHNVPEHLLNQVQAAQEVCVLIGPEGDFSSTEIKEAVEAGFKPVSLGSTRLRTETAAVMACHAVHLAQVLDKR
ncbi:RsmE family RNA methyltransferase [Arundinibacter roseus]|uniref:Ribosomal RNA small subunit methyltransferase E n=1 Tax=Arundinibacter roseus TaxID=2070510 RepID=A0A4R4KK22_9BACT|nr:RsmE family RNA methyltransferase [Arundinibacter roseus]TDB67009.1 16S rRNA (uracil(1498)-N(3))-methyltransferase [Arundinibacter roseus]